MKTSSLFFASIALAGSFATSQVFAGGARNGPDQQGEAIPLTLERGIKMSRVAEATRTCMQTGTAELTPLMSRIGVILGQSNLSYEHKGDFHQLTLLEEGKAPMFRPGLAQNKKVIGYATFASSFENGYRIGKDNAPYGPWNKITLDMTPIGSAHYGFAMHDLVPSIHFSYIFITPVNVWERASVSFLGSESSFIPFIQWKKMAKDLEHDELGSVIEDNLYIQDISIRVPKNFGKGGEVIEFRNRKTQRSVFKLNVTEYVECLKSEIERNAGE